jgi:hypothetical protein
MGHPQVALFSTNHQPEEQPVETHMNLFGKLAVFAYYSMGTMSTSIFLALTTQSYGHGKKWTRLI